MEKQGKIIKNCIYSVLNYFLLIISGLIVRKVLIAELSIEYAGYEAFFSDIFTILSVADLGLDSIISYKLYEQLACGENRINYIMSIAKQLYRWIACVVLLIGGCMFFVFFIFFHAGIENGKILCIVFLIQIANLGISYAMGYARILFVADQKEYICIRWDSAILLTIQLARIVVLIVWKDFIIYVSFCIIQTIIQNSGILYKCSKVYGNIFSYKISNRKCLEFIKDDVTHFISHRLSSIIFNATDSIVISTILGAAVAGLYSNYYMVSKYAYSLISKMIRPLQATIGNYLHKDTSKEIKIQLLQKLNIISFVFASFLCTCLINLSTPFINIWLGENYILNQRLVYLLAINMYIAINQDFIFYFRNSFGDYDYDKKYMMLSAIVNLTLSIMLIRIGLEGIVIATILGHILIWYGRTKFVYKKYFSISMLGYWIEQIFFFLILHIHIRITNHIVNHIGTNLGGLVIRGLVIGGITFVMGSMILGVKIIATKKQDVDK